MPLCEDCKYFRRARRPSELIASELPATEEVASALAHQQDREREMEKTEKDEKIKARVSGSGAWLARPEVSNFCAFRETEGIYLIPELKNRTHCDDFAARGPARLCDGCSWRVAAAGWARDRKLEQEAADIVAAGIAWQVPTQGPNTLDAVHRQASARRTYEIESATVSNGVLGELPDYFDHCRCFSSTDTYVLCSFRNPHSACPARLSLVALDASLDLYCFHECAASGHTFLPTAEQRQAWRDHVASVYSSLPAEAWTFFESAPTTLARRQKTWSQASADGRRVAISRWDPTLRNLRALAHGAFTGSGAQQTSGPPASREGTLERELERQQKETARLQRIEMYRQWTQSSHESIMKILGNI
jgi:hypothetical protein